MQIAQFCYKRDQIPTRNRANQRTLLKVEEDTKKGSGREGKVFCKEPYSHMESTHESPSVLQSFKKYRKYKNPTLFVTHVLKKVQVRRHIPVNRKKGT